MSGRAMEMRVAAHARTCIVRRRPELRTCYGGHILTRGLPNEWAESGDASAVSDPDKGIGSVRSYEQ
jgi:hypothetical protein